MHQRDFPSYNFPRCRSALQETSLRFGLTVVRRGLEAVERRIKCWGKIVLYITTAPRPAGYQSNIQDTITALLAELQASRKRR